MIAARIMNCAGADRLRQRALGGDREALELLVLYFPADLPPAALRDWRDREIGRLAGWLWARLPGAGVTRVSAILADAGQLLESRRRGLGSHPRFAALSTEERRELEREVRDLLALGVRWPHARRVRTLLSDRAISSP